ncbi:uncharacterized protein [Clytia hemisphaerica]|uniref:Cnidarian restricted protein n=1 Tax=Clytia hemisphaerica TaxID=252671 RepID=A0A7M5X1T9_9CNID
MLLIILFLFASIAPDLVHLFGDDSSSKPLTGTITWYNGLCQEVDGRKRFYVEKKGYEYCDGLCPLDRLPPYGIEFSFCYFCCWANKTVELLHEEKHFPDQLAASEERGDKYQSWFHIAFALLCTFILINIVFIVAINVNKYLNRKNRANIQPDELGEQTRPKNRPNGISNAANFDVVISQREDQHEVASNTPLTDRASGSIPFEGHGGININKTFSSSLASSLDSEQDDDSFPTTGQRHQPPSPVTYDVSERGQPAFTPSLTTGAATNLHNGNSACLSPPMMSAILEDIPLGQRSEQSEERRMREAPESNVASDTC